MAHCTLSSLSYDIGWKPLHVLNNVSRTLGAVVTRAGLEASRASSPTLYCNVAILMTQVLKQCGNDFSRENTMKQAANVKNFDLPLLLPGIKVNTSPTDHAPIEQEQLAEFHGEKWALFGEALDAFRK